MSASSEFKSVFQIETLKDIYFSFVKYNSAIGIDKINSKIFERNLDQNISIIRKKALIGIYTFSQYREKLISRGAKRLPRVISIPTIRDKLTLKALFRILASVYGEESPFLHKVVNEVNYSIHQKHFDGVIRLDVKDFYPSIKHDLLLTQISKKIKKKEIIHLISDSISQQTVCSGTGRKKIINSIGIPQGLPISNILANVYLLPIDRKYKKRTSLMYFRYVDDFLVFCKKEKIEQIKNEITRDCQAIGLQLHGDDEPDKIHTGLVKSGFSYLGYVFKDSMVTVREKSVEKLRESIIGLFTSYKYSEKIDTSYLFWTLNLRITGCQFNETKYGWLFYFSQINDIQLLASLDHFVYKQLKDFSLGSNKAQAKKFIRSYYEITKNLNNSNYIPNYDQITLIEKKQILQTVFKIDVDKLQDSQIDYRFKHNIFRSVKVIERDLSKHS
ncbi:MAG: reverse transcriptase domain-containing protein [Anaerolineaceae bacterium]|nr:reverse transcriptase domain-containing protein [Anaerolineaceae bacterium]